MDKSSDRRRFGLKLKRPNPWTPRWLPASVRDTLNNKHHSRDFNFARSDYLRTRVLFVAITFFLLAPLWIIIDYLLLPQDVLINIIASRLILMVLLAFVIYAALRNKHHLNSIRNTLALYHCLLLPSLAYFLLPLLKALA